MLGLIEGKYYEREDKSSQEQQQLEQQQHVQDTEMRREMRVGGAQTGPKGVANDLKFHKQQQAARDGEVQRRAVERLNSTGLRSGWLQRQLQQEERASSAFGGVCELDSSTFGTSIDAMPPTLRIVIHLYDTSLTICNMVNAHLDDLAASYPYAKFCKMDARHARLN